MSSIDLRTRGRAIRAVEPAAFLEETWPERLREHGALAARGAERLRLAPLALGIEGPCWTLRVRGDSLVIDPGDAHAGVRVELARDAFAELVDDHKSTLGLALAGRARVVRGAMDGFVAWEPVLRAALDGRAVYEPGNIALRGRDGSPLDPGRRFAPDAPRDELHHFLCEAGFLHLESVFTEAEMRAVAADLERAADDARPDDGTSWWVRTASGTQRPCRILDFIEKSSALRALFADARFARLAELTDDGHRHLDTFGEHLGAPVAEGLIKPIDVREGISDLPWHKDCARGGHSRFCCGLTVGISVTGADAESGALCVVAGSHRANVRGSFLDPDLDLPQLPIETRTGDVTIHCSCTLHMARPPVARERMVVYTGLGLPPLPGDEMGEPELAALKKERGDIDRQARELVREATR